MLCVWKVRLTEQVLGAHTSVIDDQSRQSSLSSFSLTQHNPVSIFSGTLLNTSLFTYHSTISFSTVLCATGTQAKLTTLASRLILDHDAGISTHSRSPVPTHSRSAIFNTPTADEDDRSPIRLTSFTCFSRGSALVRTSATISSVGT